MKSLEISNLARQFGHRFVIKQFNLELAAGEKVALLGPNGSGKTTILRIVAGILRPTGGTVIAGRVAYVPQDAPVYPELTAAEHVAWWAGIYGVEPTNDDVTQFAGRLAGVLSRGQKQRLHLAMALQSKADLLVLDEPFAALDSESQAWLELRLAQYSGAVLFAAHDADQAARVASRSITLEAP